MHPLRTFTQSVPHFPTNNPVESSLSRTLHSARILHPALATVVIGLGAVAAHALDADRILVHNVGDLAIKPQFGQATLYTDNVFFGNDSIFLSGGGVTNIPIRPKEDDLVVTASPGVKFQYGTESANLITLEYGFDQIFYTGHSENDTQQHRIDLSSRYEFGKFRLTGRDSIAFLSSPLGGGAYTDVNRAADRNFILDRRQTTLDHQLLFDYSDKTDAYGQFHFQETDFDNTTTLLDVNTLRGSLGSTYKYSELLGIFTEGFYGQTAVSPNVGNFSGAWSQFYGGFVGVRGELTPKIRGSVKLGYEQREFPSADTGISSPAFDITLDYALGPKTSFALPYSRRTSASVQFADQSFVFDTVNFSVNQGLGTSGKWTTFGSVRYDGATYDELPELGKLTSANSIFYPERQDMTLSFALGLIYQPQPWCLVTLGYEFEHFDTDAVSFLVNKTTLQPDFSREYPYLVDYDAHRIFLKFSFGY